MAGWIDMDVSNLTWLRREWTSDRQLNGQNGVGVAMAYAIAAAIERADIVCRCTRRSGACTRNRTRTRKLWLLREPNWRLPSACSELWLWCLLNLLLADLLLLRHARMSRRSGVPNTWVRTMTWCAICLLGSRLLLHGCAAGWWEVLLLRVIWWRRVLRLRLACTRRRWVVLVLLLVRGRRRWRWWVGLAAWRRRVVLLLGVLVCRVSVLRFAMDEVKPKCSQESTYHNLLSQAVLSIVSPDPNVFSS